MDSDELMSKINELGDKIRRYLQMTTGQKWEIETVIMKWDLLYKCKCGDITAVSSSLYLEKLIGADIDELSYREGIMINRYYLQEMRNKTGLNKERGQGLVEMAIATPLLIFILLGLFEVGYALRDYLTLANANRETARFAVRSDYLDFDAPDQAGVGYDKVVEHAYSALGGLADDFAANGTMIVSYTSVDTGLPCDPEEKADPIPGDDWPNCNCELAAMHPYTPAVILAPFTDARYGYRLPVDSPAASKINFDMLVETLRYNNILVNCGRLKQAAIPYPKHEVITVEMFYQHRQLFGFPILSNSLTDPIPMYTHTTMRISPSREDKK